MLKLTLLVLAACSSAALQPLAAQLVRRPSSLRPNIVAAAAAASAGDDDLLAAQGGAAQAGGGASVASSMINLVKAIVGSGVLSLPVGIAAFSSSRTAVMPSSISRSGASPAWWVTAST